MSNPVRAVLSCLAVFLLLATSMASVCAASCGVRMVARGGCHGMVSTAMPGMRHGQTMQGQPGQQVMLHCAGMPCAWRAEAALVQVGWPVAEVPVQAAWVRLPAAQDAVPLSPQDVERGEGFPLPPLRVPLRV